MKYRYVLPIDDLKRTDVSVKAQKGILEIHGSIVKPNFSREVSHAFTLPSDAIMRSLKWYIRNGMLHISLDKRVNVKPK
jgi:HSP20 family molecular chaperone IbpA